MVPSAFVLKAIVVKFTCAKYLGTLHAILVTILLHDYNAMFVRYDMQQCQV